ncbi:hypothetical protein ACLOAV_010423 [Pseudogymnoascus australis]
MGRPRGSKKPIAEKLIAIATKEEEVFSTTYQGLPLQKLQSLEKWSTWAKSTTLKYPEKRALTFLNDLEHCVSGSPDTKLRLHSAPAREDSQGTTKGDEHEEEPQTELRRGPTRSGYEAASDEARDVPQQRQLDPERTATASSLRQHESTRQSLSIDGLQNESEFSGEHDRLSGNPNFISHQQHLVFEKASLQGITTVFDPYMCDAIRRDTPQSGDITCLKAAVTMDFPIEGLDDCLMSLAIHESK